MSPLWEEKPKNRPVSKNNTGRAALRAVLPVTKNEKYHTLSSHVDVRRSIFIKFCIMIEVARAIISLANFFGSRQ